MKLKVFISALFLILLAGCTTVTMTGKAFAPVDPLGVKIFFSEKPKCPFQELAFITSPTSWNQNVAISKARDKAAEIGADYLVITQVFINNFNDASVWGVAYKCGEVDRNKVDLRTPQ